MLESLLSEIHATPHMMTMNFAGAGSQALMWLHSVGGSSRTVLEATDRYVPASLIEAVGFTPERFTSVETAKALAKNAYQRAQHLAPKGKPVFGLGCTATIATDRAKKGDHRCAIAVQDTLGAVSYELVLQKGNRNRQAEEELLSLLIIKAITDACGVFKEPPLQLLDGERLVISFDPAPALLQLIAGTIDILRLETNGNLQPAKTLSNLAILSGSFHPLHVGHRQLAQAASEQLSKLVEFELPLINADKAPIDLLEARNRAVQFLGYAPLIFSRFPLFNEKAKYYPKSTFVVGADTAARLVALRFYGDEQKLRAALDDLRKHGAQFLVAGRSSKGDFHTLKDIAIPEGYRDLFSEIPKSAFHMDISSSEIRAQNVQP